MLPEIILAENCFPVLFAHLYINVHMHCTATATYIEGCYFMQYEYCTTYYYEIQSRQEIMKEIMHNGGQYSNICSNMSNMA